MDQFVETLKKENVSLPDINMIVLSNYYNCMLKMWKKEKIFNERIFSHILISLSDFISYYEKSGKKPFVYSYIEAWWKSAKELSDVYKKENSFFKTYTLKKQKVNS